MSTFARATFNQLLKKIAYIHTNCHQIKRGLRIHNFGMVSSKNWINCKRFSGAPVLTDFKLEEEELPEIAQGEILAQAEFFSVDPYMRPYMEQFPVGSLMIGGQIAKIIESKNEDFPKGAYMFGQFGWRTHTVVNPSKIQEWKPYVLPDFGDLPRSLGLGSLGMPGNTAYFGFLEICKPKPEETVVVSGAAGAVGSMVGQIAKLKGCRVIGIAGTDEKCAWLKEIGFHETINYKTENVRAALKKAAPMGVDCYFDNVGGEISSIVTDKMNLFGRISVCGTISNYSTDIKMVRDPQRMFVFKQLKQEGFIVYRWEDRWMEGIEQNMKWIKEGLIHTHETVTEGFENMPQAFIDMLNGGNTGKAIVKV